MHNILYVNRGLPCGLPIIRVNLSCESWQSVSMVPLVYHPRTTSRPSAWSGCTPSTAGSTAASTTHLIASGLRKSGDFVRPPPSQGSPEAPHRRNICGRSGARRRWPDSGGADRPRLPGWLIDWRILADAVCHRGTILACRLALEHGMAINLGGGFHHAAAGWGGGFCVYADVPWRRSCTTRASWAGCLWWTSTPTRATAPPPSCGSGPGHSFSTSTRKTSSPRIRNRKTIRCRSGPAWQGANTWGSSEIRARSPGCRPARPGALQRWLGPVRGRPAGPACGSDLT